jgi:nitrate/TMAO reductase-like tetraheme cytochrome c subunit
MGQGVSGEKFAQERKRMAAEVWAECRANDSRACRGCHQFSPEVLAKQQEMVGPNHAPVLDGKATCIDCHKGVGHAAP